MSNLPAPPLLVCLVGVVVYALAGNAKVSEMGRLAFAVGLLVLVWQLAGRTVRL